MSDMRWICQLGDGYMLGVDGKVLHKVKTGYPYPKVEGGQVDALCGMFGLQSTKFSCSVKVLNDVVFPISFLDAFELLCGDRGLSVLSEDWFTSVSTSISDICTDTTTNASGGDIFFSKDVLSNIFSEEERDDGIFSFFLDDASEGSDVAGVVTRGVEHGSDMDSGTYGLEGGTEIGVDDSRIHCGAVEGSVHGDEAERGTVDIDKELGSASIDLDKDAKESQVSSSDDLMREVGEVQFSGDTDGVRIFKQVLSELAVASMPEACVISNNTMVTKESDLGIKTDNVCSVGYDFSLGMVADGDKNIPVVLGDRNELPSMSTTELQAIPEEDGALIEDVYGFMVELESNPKRYTCELENDMLLVICDGLGVSLGIDEVFVQECLWGLFSEPSMPKNAFRVLDKNTVGVKLSDVIPKDLCNFYFNDLIGRDDYVSERNFSFKKVLDNFLNSKPKSKKKTELLSLYTVKGARVANKRSKEWGIKSSGRPVCRLVDILYQIGGWEFSEKDMSDLFVKSCGITLRAISKEESWMFPFVNVKELLKAFMRDMRYIIWWLIDDTARLYGYEGYLNFSEYDLVLKSRGDNELCIFYRKSLIGKR